ncbi:MAG: AAA family ATPase [Bryobacter sp.]|nr:AAA family ATPase [Bryobacter sp.]
MEKLTRSHESVLSQRAGPPYPEITTLKDAFSEVRIFDEWIFAAGSAIRKAQPADGIGGFLLEDGSNLALALQELVSAGVEDRLSDLLQTANPLYRKFVLKPVGGAFQVTLMEGTEQFTPASRLSRGTLQLLCLAAVLLHPQPPPVVCIEEPEIGLHPDMMTTLAKLLREAATRTQVIVTTHSEILVDALTDSPESILICERGPAGTNLQRLQQEELKVWLEHYSLGQLWRKGELGGNRW